MSGEVMNEAPDARPDRGGAVPSSVAHTRLVLRPGASNRYYWTDLWAYRELYLVLAWRDVAVRYKQTMIGVAWALVRPLLTMLIFTIVFGGIAKLSADGSTPYTLFVLAGLLPWYLFATIVGEASNSVVTNAQLVSKVYFPRLIIPSASAVVAVVDFAINLGLVALLMIALGVGPSWQIIFLPVFALLAVACGLGPAFYLAALNVKYRDFRFITPFIVQLGVYISPVGFSSAVVPVEWQLLYALNPLVGVIDGFRWCLFPTSSPFNATSLAVSAAAASLMMWLGIRQFRATEKSFADLI